MTSKADEQRERERVLHNDELVREQAGTFMSHTHSDVGGRFSAVGAQTVVGAEPITNYPAAAAHQRDPVPDEPPLGYRIDAMPEQEPSTVLSSPCPVEVTDDPADAPSGGSLVEQTYGGLVSNERAGSSPLPEKE